MNPICGGVTDVTVQRIYGNDKADLSKQLYQP